MKDNFIIGISGESGVGKTTISKIISYFFGVDNTTSLSTDDLHKWDRKDPTWNGITHYNPEANNLELGDIHLKYLSEGKSIYRSVYNHDTGYFNPPFKITPKNIIVIDGLHAFYTKFSKETIDLKIYVDTEESLRAHWKIMRDTEERGYKYSDVLETINKRKNDGDVIRQEQINSADVIITIKPSKPIINLGDKNEEVDVEMEFSNTNSKYYSLNNVEDLFSFIKNYNDEFNTFIKVSEKIGDDWNLCQNGGGNISTKINDKFMFIKASGYNMKDAYKLKAYSLIDYETIKINLPIVNDDDSLNSLVNKNIIANKTPSMETAFHILLDKYVIHTHPIHLTTLLCLENSENIIKSLFSDYEYEYIKYVNPAFDLYKEIDKTNKDKKIYFLENHGLIITSNDVELAISLTFSLDETAKKYLNRFDIKNFDSSFFTEMIGDDNSFTFPDSVIFSDDNTKREIIGAHNYIITSGKQLGKLRYLTYGNSHYLRNMKTEKYRKTL